MKRLWQYNYSNELYHKNGYKYIDRIKTSKGWRYIYDTGKKVGNFFTAKNERTAVKEAKQEESYARKYGSFYKPVASRRFKYDSNYDRVRNDSFKREKTGTFKKGSQAAWYANAYDASARRRRAEDKLEKSKTIPGAVIRGKKAVNNFIAKLKYNADKTYTKSSDAASKSIKNGKKKVEDVIGLTARKKVENAYVKRSATDRAELRSRYGANDATVKDHTYTIRSRAALNEEAHKHQKRAIEEQRKAYMAYKQTPLGKVENLIGRGGVSNKVLKRENEAFNAEYQRLKKQEEEKKKKKR